MTIPKIILVKMAEYVIGRDSEILTCVGLGSCVGIALYHAPSKMGGLAHIMLPRQAEVPHSSHNPAKFADSAIAAMIKDMEHLGATLRNIRAKIFGGANMFSNIQSEMLSVGEKNIAVIREELTKRKIPIETEELGGSSGRTLFFDTRDGSVRVKTVYGQEKNY